MKIFVKVIAVVLFFIFLSLPVFAKEYVYLKMDSKNVGVNTVYLDLVKGQSYVFYGWGSSQISKVSLYVKGEGLSDDGKTASITFTPQQAKTYELDIIGYQNNVKVASQKFYLEVTGQQTEKEEGCIEDWGCSDWSTCLDNVQRRSCTDKNNCGTFGGKPIDTRSCIEESSESTGEKVEKGTTETATSEQKFPQETKSDDTSDSITHSKEADCGSYDEADFFSVCEYIKCKKQQYTFVIKDKERLRMGFTDTENEVNNRDYNADLTEDGIAVVYNLNNYKTYLFVGRNQDKEKISSLINEYEVRNDPCSAFYKFHSSLKEIKSKKQKEEDKNNGGQEKVKSLTIESGLCKEVIPGHNNPSANRANIVFLGFGLDSPDDVKEWAGYMADFDGDNHGLFSVDPFKSNKNRFNFWYIDKIHPMEDITRIDGLGGPIKEKVCYFPKYTEDFGDSPYAYRGECLDILRLTSNCAFNNKYETYLVNKKFRGSGGNPIQLDLPLQDLKDILNPEDPIVREYLERYGSERNKEIVEDWIISTSKTFVHEFGHSFGRLLDEYIEARFASTGGGVTQGLSLGFYRNCFDAESKEECLKNTQWKGFIGRGCGDDKKVDCRKENENYNLEINCVDGCSFTEHGVYRSAFNTIMRSYFTDPFEFGAWNEKLLKEEIDKFSEE